MALVTSKEIAQVIGLQKFGFLGTFVGWLLIKVLRISAINRIYNKNKSKADLNFLNGVLDDCNIKFEVPEEDLKRIPKDGVFITVLNHHFRIIKFQRSPFILPIKNLSFYAYIECKLY